MPESFDLLDRYRPSSLVALGRSGEVRGADLSAAILRIGAALEGEGPVIVACGDRLASIAAFLAAARGGRPALFPPSLKIDTVRELERASGAFVLHDQSLASGLDVRPLVAAAADPEGQRGVVEVRVPAERVLAVFHTSGSTGAPTAHAKTGAHLVLEAEMQASRLAMSPADRVLATVPTHHLYGFLFGALVPLRAGAAVVADTPIAPAAVAAEARARCATMLASVPAHLRAIAALGPAELKGAFRHVVSSGAPLDRADAEAAGAALGVAVEEIFGSTETGGIATRRCPRESYDPLPGVEVEVRSGVLHVRSPYLASLDGGAFVTADRARLESDGGIALLGRRDDVVKVGGKRVSAREVEARLRAIPGVRDALVRPERSTAARGSRLAAVVEGDALDPAALRAELGRYFDDVVVPRRVVVVPLLPRSAAGKVDEATLSGLVAAEPPGIALRPRDGVPGAFEAHVSSALPLFAGHFPGDPLVPGVVQLRDLVVAAARRTFPALGPLTGLSRVKFKRPLRPGAAVDLVLKRPDPTTVRFRITERTEECASGLLHFAPD